jgi:small GTP-binding protein
MSNEFIMKVIIVGNPSVGKSNLILQYTENKFNSEHSPTLGLDFSTKKVQLNNITFTCQLWDTAGQEQFQSITSKYYKDSTCAVIVFDITDRKSFISVKKWHHDITKECDDNVVIALVGNKCDLENKRQVTYDDARTLADELNVSYYETSAKTGDNIDNMFKELIQVVEEIIRNDENGWMNMKLSKMDKLVLEHDNNNRHKYCYGYSGKC